MLLETRFSHTFPLFLARDLFLRTAPPTGLAPSAAAFSTHALALLMLPALAFLAFPLLHLHQQTVTISDCIHRVPTNLPGATLLNMEEREEIEALDNEVIDIFWEAHAGYKEEYQQGLQLIRTVQEMWKNRDGTTAASPVFLSA